MAKHQKHSNLVRRQNDHYASNEISILGTNCGVISELVQKLSEHFSNYKLAYFDASHAQNVVKNKIATYTFHHEGNLQITTSGNLNKFEKRLQFAHYDFVFINGNHYQGAKQILILDEEKEASVLKRLDQLDRIEFVIKLKKESSFFSFLEEKYPHINTLKCYTIDEVAKIANHLDDLIQEKVPSVKGLVLIGGKSTRMGADKSTLDYHGIPQRKFVQEIIENHTLETYFSVQDSSENESEISDVFLNLGPFGGICSAFQKDPNAAWLAVAIDLPFINEEVIQFLLEKRNPSKVATAIKGKGNAFVEPLITIYEPKAYPILLQYLAQGYSCPRKMLINSDVEIVEIDASLILNVNTPEAFEAAKKEINSKHG